jgi:hypothetical protein
VSNGVLNRMRIIFILYWRNRIMSHGVAPSIMVLECRVRC